MSSATLGGMTRYMQTVAWLGWMVCMTVGCSAASEPVSAGDDTSSLEKDCSTVCKTEGRCFLADDQQCVADSNAQCQSANICLKLGKCAADSGLCIAATSDDCRASTDCGVFGKCGLGVRECVAVSAEDCINAFWCGSEGFCSLVGTECVVATDEDCQRSDLCKEYDECWADPGGFCYEK